MIVPAHTPRLRRDQRGAVIVEFAIIAPVFLLLLMGIFDIGHTLYMTSALQGALQKAARDSTLETNTLAAQQAFLDARVREQAKTLMNTADIDIKRRFYRTFSAAAAARHEDWIDTNENHLCDADEPYEDANHNNVWDADGGNAGQGGAKDASVITVTATYPHLFPLMALMGRDNENVQIKAVTVLRNQPYSDQNSYGPPVTRQCT